ncbi:MAG: hypothetical protein P1P77_11440, partial [Spirochaetaceae bacterium]|nr:hypothetical protein [Spirochaetaceae bacterium]
IVGYYRSVRNWNKGKKEEYTKRLNYTGLSDERPLPGAGPSLTEAVPRLVTDDDSQKQLSFSPESGPSEYLYFFRKTCPNCPPVAAWLDASALTGRKIDVDRESGMHEARRFDVSAAPTAILLDSAGREVGRGSTVESLESLAGMTAVAGA